MWLFHGGWEREGALKERTGILHDHLRLSIYLWTNLQHLPFLVVSVGSLSTLGSLHGATVPAVSTTHVLAHIFNRALIPV